VCVKMKDQQNTGDCPVVSPPLLRFAGKRDLSAKVGDPKRVNEEKEIEL
jgi:hypothetical protein